MDKSSEEYKIRQDVYSHFYKVKKDYSEDKKVLNWIIAVALNYLLITKTPFGQISFPNLPKILQIIIVFGGMIASLLAIVYLCHLIIDRPIKREQTAKNEVNEKYNLLLHKLLLEEDTNPKE